MLRTTAHRYAVVGLTVSALAFSIAIAVASPNDQAVRHGGYINRTHVPGGYARSLTVDRTGRDHWLAAGRALYSLFPGEKKATREVYDVSNAFGSNRPTIRQLVPSVSGNGIDVVSSSCSSLQVFSIRSKVRSLPKLTPAMNVAQSPCELGTLGGLANPSGAVALARGRVAVLYPYNPLTGNANRATVYIGKPGHTFQQTLLPHYQPADSRGFAAIARDPSNGSLYVAQSSDVGSLIVSYARTSHDKFQAPVTVDTTLAEQRVTSIAASRKSVWIALERPYGNERGSYLATRGPSGHWSQVERVPGTPGRDLMPLVTATPRSKRASAWEADGYDNSGSPSPNVGIEFRHLSAGGIGSAHTYTTLAEGLESIAADWHDRLNFSYER